jgi:DNA repair exonuclease SbcCD ATPase subunit
MDEIADSGVDVLARSQSAEDVTEEYVDVQSRLEALEAARERLLELLDEAETTEALLEAERQLTQREQEINALRGRLQFLEESAALSLISVSISPTRTSQPIDTRWRPGETFREAVDRLLESLRNFVDFVIIFSISVLPWLLVFGAVAYGVIRAVTWAIRRFTSRGNDTS